MTNKDDTVTQKNEEEMGIGETTVDNCQGNKNYDDSNYYKNKSNQLNKSKNNNREDKSTNKRKCQLTSTIRPEKFKASTSQNSLFFLINDKHNQFHAPSYTPKPSLTFHHIFFLG
jgi:hypothetical protein